MIISTANINGLNRTLEKRFREVYEATPTWWQQIATMIPSSTRDNVYAWLANTIRLREWIGPRQAIAMQAHDYVLKNLPFEATFRIPRADILDDSLGIYTAAVVPQFSEATAKHPDSEIVSRVFQTNPTGFDGVAFFTSNHPTFAPVGFATTYDNDFTEELGPTLADAADAVNTVRTAMRTRIGENGLTLMVDPRLLIVPPQLERIVRELTTAEWLPDGSAGATKGTNFFKAMLDVLVIPELADDPTTWYLADVGKALKPFIWQVRSNPILRSFDTGTERESFELDEFTWGIDGDDGGAYRANAGVTLPFLISRSVGPT